MCFDAIQEGGGLWFSAFKEPRVELPHTRYGVGEDLVPLSIW